MMLAQEEVEEVETVKNYGKVYPLKAGYYSNPQMCMFIFTLLLTIFLSMIMILNVFLGFYHKIIGIILCLYCTYRFISLGLSNPGLAVEFYEDFARKNQHQLLYNQHTNINLSNKNRNQNFADNPQRINLHQQKTQNYQKQTTNGNQHQNKSQFFEQNERVVSQYQMYQNPLMKQFYGFCNVCKVPTRRRTKHCSFCKTCIDGHDHHCIWIGKCIGKKNMWEFKDFLCFVFGTLIYALVLSLRMAKVQTVSS